MWCLLAAAATFSAPLAAVEEAGAAPNQAPPATIAPQFMLAGPKAAHVADQLTDNELQRVRDRLALVIGPAESGTLALGLSELGKRDTRYAIATAEGSDGRRLAAGVATYQIGRNRLDSRAKSLSGGVASKRYPAAPASVAMQLSTRDLDDGRFVRQDDDASVATLTIRAENSQVTSWRRFGPPLKNWPGGSVVQGGPGVASSPTSSYPLTVPQVGMAKVNTTVAVPLGSAAFAPAWDAYIDSLAAGTIVRDPDVAWAIYRQSLELAERAWPTAQVVWTTMPLAGTRNTLRNWFNAQVRQHAMAHGKPLLDIAAIQSVGDDGRPALDAEGECSQPANVTSGNPSKLSLDGAVKVAKAWWWLQAKLSEPAK